MSRSSVTHVSTPAATTSHTATKPGQGRPHKDPKEPSPSPSPSPSAATTSLKTTKRGRGRGRPRKTAKQPSPSPSASPVTTEPPVKKRRKLLQADRPTQEDIFAVKDIIDEKVIDSKHFYKIDWEDDPLTGEIYEPTWEPAENVTELAIKDWEQARQHQVLPEPSPNLLPNQSPVLEASSPYSRSQGISIVLLSKSDFLRTKPDLDTDSVIAISTSQISDLDTDSDLPPSQFWVPSSQPSQDIISDSQPALTGSPAHVSPSKARAGISQTTIPDSQDFSNVLSQDSVEVPGTAEQSKKAGSASPNGSHKESSGSTIPSRQPDYNQVFADENLATHPEHHSLSQDDLGHNHSFVSPLPAPSNDQDTPSDPCGAFLSQPAFEPGEFAISTESEAKSQSQSQSRVTADNQSAPVEDTSQSESYQPAQLVSPLPDRRSQPFSPQIDTDFFAASEEYEVVPDSSLQPPGHTDPQQLAPPHRPAYTSATSGPQYVSRTFQGDIKFADTTRIANCWNSDHSIKQHAFATFEKPEYAMMEDSQASSAPKQRSALDAFRAVQMEFVSSSPHRASLSNDTATTSGDGGPGLEDELLAPVSPSAIINSVEQDPVPVDNEQQASLDVPNGVVWDQAPLATALTANSLGPQHDFVSAVDSNVASLANTLPSSGIVNQAPGMGLDSAFAATAFSHEFGSRLQATENDQGTISPAQLTGSGYEPDGFGDVSSAEDSRVVPSTDAALLRRSLPGPMVPDALGDASYKGDLGALAGDGSPQNLDTAMPDQHDLGILPFEDTAPNEYFTPLPPPARSRQEMITMLKAHSEEIRSFISQFSSGGAAQSPSSKATAKIDAMLETLAEFSNLPPYHQDLQDLSPNEWMRYARDTCSKLSFVYELINQLRDANIEVVILAAGGAVMEKVEAIVSQSHITYRYAQQDWPATLPEQDSTSACKVVLVDTALRATEQILTGNLVVAYDESAESSGLLQKYKTTEAANQNPMIFTLVEVYSLEHINRRLSPVMDPLERRLAQIKCLDLLIRHVEQDGGLEHVTAPIDLAEELAHYMVEDNKFMPPEVRWETWEHQMIPTSILDEYQGFRESLGRDKKRARVSSSSGTEVSKRPRIGSSSTDEIQFSVALKKRLGPDIGVKGGVAEVSVQKLEDLVTLVGELQTALNSKGKEVEDYADTVRKFQPKYREAINDRAKFEAERDQAVKVLADVEKKLARTSASLETVTSQKGQLQGLHEKAAQTDDQEAARAAAVQLAERKYDAEKEAAARKLASANDRIEYVQSSYREASSQVGALRQENEQLALRVRELETRAGENVAAAHVAHKDDAAAQLRTMYEQERGLRADREREIERKNEEIRGLKARFGGRETRGSSVPRSPRIRQMGSRNTSPVGDFGGAGAAGAAGNGLGGGGTLFGPRGAHLRDG